MRSRQRILEAVLELVRSGGFGSVNIAAVASAAGVSRQTVYSIFGSREELVSQAVAGFAVTALGDIHARLQTARTPLEYVVEFIVAGRAVLREDPLLTSLLLATDGNPMFDAGMMSRAKPVARELFLPIVELDPSIEPHLEDIVNVSVRFGLSVIIFDDETVHLDDDLRRFLRQWLGPAMSKLDS